MDTGETHRKCRYIYKGLRLATKIHPARVGVAFRAAMLKAICSARHELNRLCVP